MEVSLFSTGNFHFKLDLDRVCVRAYGLCICHACFVPVFDKLVEKSRSTNERGLWKEIP